MEYLNLLILYFKNGGVAFASECRDVLVFLGGGSKDFQCDVVVHVSGHSKISGSL